MSCAIFHELYAEQKKTRHRHIWLVPSCFFLFECIWIVWQLGNAGPEELTNGYPMLFYHMPVMNTILLPLMAAVIASRLCDMEIKGDTLKLLYTMQQPSGFFDCKFLGGAKYFLFFILGHGILFLLLGRIYHFKNPLKPYMLLFYLVSTFSVSVILLAIQQTLSLMSVSQIMPLVVGLAGSFLGLFSLFFPDPAAKLVIWGYFAAFPCVKMNWNPSDRIMRFSEIPVSVPGFLIFLTAGVCIYIICRTLVTKKEV